MHRVTLRFEDGETRVVESDGEETIYQAALRAGVVLLTDCLEGACATCKARCASGEYELLDPSFEALSAAEEAAGHVLLCQMQARADCAIDVPYGLGFAAGVPPRTLTGRVAAVERLSPAIVRLGLSLEADPPLRFVAGQYARLRVPGSELSRAYSFANPPAEPDLACFYVRLIEAGAMSAYLAEAAPGDRIALEAPLGGFHLRAGGGPILMVAGGTGLAPMLSMLAALSRAEARPVTVLHGVRDPSDRFPHEALAAAGAGLSLAAEVIVERPGSEWPGPTGRATDLLTPARVVAPDTDAYLCGPPAMVAAAEARLAEFGVPAPRVFAERFNPAG